MARKECCSIELVWAGAIIAAVSDITLRILIFPIFGIPFTYQTYLYPFMGFIIGFATIMLLSWGFGFDLYDSRFTALAPIVGAILMPILRIVVTPMFAIEPLVPPVDYIFIGFWDMLITAAILRYISGGKKKRR